VTTMPVYELQCVGCESVQEEILGLSEFDNRDKDKLDLSDINISCIKCGKTKFRKLLSAHGKSAHNWSAWQRRGNET